MRKIKPFLKKLIRLVARTLLRTVIFSLIIMLVLVVWKGERDFGALWNVGVFIGFLSALIYPLVMSANSFAFLDNNRYKKDLAILNLRDTVKFSELLKINIGKCKSLRCGLYLTSNHLVFQKPTKNEEIALSDIINVYPVRKSILAKLRIDDEFAVVTGRETYVFKTCCQKEWVEKIKKEKGM